jgi:hypothetical protein
MRSQSRRDPRAERRRHSRRPGRPAALAGAREPRVASAGQAELLERDRHHAFTRSRIVAGRRQPAGAGARAAAQRPASIELREATLPAPRRNGAAPHSRVVRIQHAESAAAPDRVEALLPSVETAALISPSCGTPSIGAIRRRFGFASRHHCQNNRCGDGGQKAAHGHPPIHWRHFHTKNIGRRGDFVEEWLDHELVSVEQEWDCNEGRYAFGPAAWRSGLVKNLRFSGVNWLSAIERRE